MTCCAELAFSDIIEEGKLSYDCVCVAMIAVQCLYFCGARTAAVESML